MWLSETPPPTVELGRVFMILDGNLLAATERRLDVLKQRNACHCGLQRGRDAIILPVTLHALTAAA
jgi:hypothetical protein